MHSSAPTTYTTKNCPDNLEPKWIRSVPICSRRFETCFVPPPEPRGKLVQGKCYFNNPSANCHNIFVLHNFSAHPPTLHLLRMSGIILDLRGTFMLFCCEIHNCAAQSDGKNMHNNFTLRTLFNVPAPCTHRYAQCTPEATRPHIWVSRRHVPTSGSRERVRILQHTDVPTSGCRALAMRNVPQFRYR